MRFWRPTGTASHTDIDPHVDRKSPGAHDARRDDAGTHGVGYPGRCLGDTYANGRYTSRTGLKLGCLLAFVCDRRDRKCPRRRRRYASGQSARLAPRAFRAAAGYGTRAP